MPTQAYDSYYNGLNNAEFDWDTATIKASLVRGYTFNAAHVFLSDVTGAGGTLVSTVTLSNRQRAAGAVWADQWTWPTVASGAAIPAFIVYQASAPTGGADLATSAQKLIAHFDGTSSGTGPAQIGLPVTPNGQGITYVPDSGVNRLLKV